MTKQLQIVELKNLVINKGTQGRVSLDQRAIKDYADDIKNALASAEAKAKEKDPKATVDLDLFMTEENPMPAVEVYRDAEGHLFLTDGFHRYNAHKEAGLKTIMANIVDVIPNESGEGERPVTLRDAILRSTAVNQGHGVRRTQNDKRRAVEILLADKEWKGRANNWIAEQAGVSEFLVRKMRPATDAGTDKTARVRGGGTTKRKGGKAAKGAGKKGGGAAGGAAGGKDKEQKGLDDESTKYLRGIERGVGGELGGKIREAVEKGKLPLTKRQLKDYNALSTKSQQAIAPLVLEKRMDPRKAYDFIKNAVSDKFLEELEIRAIACGGKFETTRNGFKLTFEKVK